MTENQNNVDKELDYYSLLSLTQTQQVTNFSRSTLYRKIKAGEFPKPVNALRHNPRFYKGEVLTYLKKLPRLH